MASNKDREPKNEPGTEVNAPEQKPQEEMVTIPKSQLSAILQRLDRVESVSDRGRLEQFDNTTKKKELSRVRLNEYDDKENGQHKVIMAWRMVIDEVMYDSGRGYTEKQIIELTLEDGTKVSINYRDFAIGKRRSQAPAEIISRKMDEESGHELMKVRRISDKKEFEVDSRFIN